LVLVFEASNSIEDLLLGLVDVGEDLGLESSELGLRDAARGTRDRRSSRGAGTGTAACGSSGGGSRGSACSSLGAPRLGCSRLCGLGRVESNWWGCGGLGLGGRSGLGPLLHASGELSHEISASSGRGLLGGLCGSAAATASTCATYGCSLRRTRALLEFVGLRGEHRGESTTTTSGIVVAS
jgi:hypothetical protein